MMKTDTSIIADENRDVLSMNVTEGDFVRDGKIMLSSCHLRIAHLTSHDEDKTFLPITSPLPTRPISQPDMTRDSSSLIADENRNVLSMNLTEGDFVRAGKIMLLDLITSCLHQREVTTG